MHQLTHGLDITINTAGWWYKSCITWVLTHVTVCFLYSTLSRSFLHSDKWMQEALSASVRILLEWTPVTCRGIFQYFDGCFCNLRGGLVLHWSVWRVFVKRGLSKVIFEWALFSLFFGQTQYKLFLEGAHLVVRYGPKGTFAGIVSQKGHLWS